MQRGRIKYSDGLKLLDGELIKEIDTGYKYFGKLQGGQIRYREMKEKLEEEYLTRVLKLLKSKLSSKK